MAKRILDRTPTRIAIETAKELDCAFLMLPRGKFVLVDCSDLPAVSEFTWNEHPGGYVSVVVSTPDGRQPLYIHRVIMKPPSHLQVDHRNRNKLDNRRCNLRICTQSQNNGNATKRSNSGYRFKGVRLMPSGKYQAYGADSGRYLGTFITEEEAARAYDKWARERWGEFAKTNFPP